MSQIHSHSAAKPSEPASYITAELSLGSRLNQSILDGKRADFSYLLALLSDNLTESSEFALTPSAEPAKAWQPPFPVGPSLPLQCREDEYQDNPAASFAQSRALWRLEHALRPAGLHPVNDAKHIPPQVIANCAHYVQQRVAGEPTDSWVAEPANLIDILQQLKERQVRGVERAVA